MAKQLAKVGYLDAKSTAFLLCDIQTIFKKSMEYFDKMVITANKLVCVSKALNIPLLVSEQYPQALGHITSDIDISSAVAVVSKTKFSMNTPELKEKLKSHFGDKLETIILFGIEAHICVEQTAMDFTNEGYKVHIVADGTISRSQEDRLLAFKRMADIGCIITTSESVIFKLLKDKNHPNFDDVKGLVKTPTLETGLAKL